MRRLTLIRGIPGSGKTTLAKQICAATGAHHLETDMYFMENGVYQYRAEKIKQAHEWCQNELKMFITSEIDLVVSNTFVKKWEMDYYMDIAQKFGYLLQVIVCQGRFDTIHGVPQDVIERMEATFEY